MHTIDELAHLSGMPSRTIRFYNTEGMLPPPTMRGRVAYY
ncbi:MAG: MerR family transcriptional regulator, partial [Ktedonobacteraceae bacterium]